MSWLRRWLLGDLAERVATLENWCRHHGIEHRVPAAPPAIRELILRAALERASGPGN